MNAHPLPPDPLLPVDGQRAAARAIASNAPGPDYNALARENRKLRPPLWRSLRADAARYAEARGERVPRSRPGSLLAILRMAWMSEDFLGVALYRLQTALAAHGVPIVPAIISRINIAFFNMEIGDGVVIGEGMYVPHGSIILGGVTTIGKQATLWPWTGIGVREGSMMGPKIGDGVVMGTRTLILGEMVIGDGAHITAGSVVTGDVPPGVTVAGVPAKPVPPTDPAPAEEGSQQ